MTATHQQRVEATRALRDADQISEIASEYARAALHTAGRARARAIRRLAEIERRQAASQARLESSTQTIQRIMDAHQEHPSFDR